MARLQYIAIHDSVQVHDIGKQSDAGPHDYRSVALATNQTTLSYNANLTGVQMCNIDYLSCCTVWLIEK